MVSSDPSNAMSNLTLSNVEENTEKDSAIVPSAKRTQFLATYRQQRFSFRASVMRYIAENPISPKLYQKMIKTCKFFFIQNPIIVLTDLNYNGIEWKQISNLHREHFVDLEKIMTKFWIINNFGVCAQKDGDQNIISLIIPKFFRMDATDIFIENQIIPLCDYVYLTSSSEKIHLSNVTVQDENGSDLPLEKLIEAASNANVFRCLSGDNVLSINSKTFDELLKLPNFRDLDAFYLSYIPETFDLEAFYIYMKQNKRTSFDLGFDAAISEAYKIRLEEIMDEILETENHEYCIPSIRFIGIQRGKWFKLLSMAHNFNF